MISMVIDGSYLLKSVRAPLSKKQSLLFTVTSFTIFKLHKIIWVQRRVDSRWINGGKHGTLFNDMSNYVEIPASFTVFVTVRFINPPFLQDIHKYISVLVTIRSWFL